MWIVEPSLQNDHPFLYSLLNWPYSETFASLFPAVLLFSLVFLLSDWIVLTRNSENALSFEDPLQIPSGPIPKPKKRGREWCEAVPQLLSAMCILLSEAPVPSLKEVELHFPSSNLWRKFDPQLHINPQTRIASNLDLSHEGNSFFSFTCLVSIYIFARVRYSVYMSIDDSRVVWTD